MNIKKNIAVTILTTSFLISGISNPIGYNVSAFRPIEVNASSIKTSDSNKYFIKNNLSCGDKMEPPLTVINPLWENLINLIGHKKLNSHVLDDVPLCCY